MPLFTGQLAVKGCQADSKSLQSCERVGKVHGELVLAHLHPSGKLEMYRLVWEAGRACSSCRPGATSCCPGMQAKQRLDTIQNCSQVGLGMMNAA